jgi:hypothetical protein
VRHLAVVVFLGLGLLMLVGGAGAEIEPDLPRYAWLGLLLAGAGSALFVLSVWAVRGLIGGTLVRGVVSLVLALGGVHLITGLIMLGVALREGSGRASFDSGTAIYSIGFGAICIAAFVVINYGSRALHQQDSNPPPSPPEGIR